MTQPIRPGQAAQRKLDLLPEGVIEVFNDLIAKNFDGTAATFQQRDVIDGLLEKNVITSRQEAFERHLLDVEPVYRATGWKVSYDKPGYNEQGSAWFIFTAEES